MARFDPAASAGWLARKAKQAAASLKGEYEAGKRGDDSPVTPIFPTPKQQLDALLGLMTSKPEHGADPDAADSATESGADDGADEVAHALRGVDWQGVKAATAERTSEAAKAMRTMAEQVDWAKVQPVAAQVSSALIAAVAAGRLPVGGPLGPTIARAITDRGALSQRIGQRFADQHAPLPPDFRSELSPTSDEPPG
jgi:hypothetical protein